MSERPVTRAAGRLRALSLQRAAASLDGPSEALEVARVEGLRVRVAWFEGTEDWEEHPHDVMVLCWEGGMTVELVGGAPIPLGPGDLVVVPAGRGHRVVAARRATALLLERAPGARPAGRPSSPRPARPSPRADGGRQESSGWLGGRERL